MKFLLTYTIFFFSFFSWNFGQNWKLKPSLPQNNIRFSNLIQLSPTQSGFVAWYVSQRALGSFEYYFEAYNPQLQLKKAWKFQAQAKQEPEFVWKTPHKDWIFLSSIQGKKKILSAGEFSPLKAEINDIQPISERNIIDRNPFSYADNPHALNPYFFHFRLNQDSTNLLIAFCHPEIEQFAQKWSFIILNTDLQIISERMITLPVQDNQSLFSQFVLTDNNDIIAFHLSFFKPTTITEKNWIPTFSYLPFGKTQFSLEAVTLPTQFRWEEIQTYQWKLFLNSSQPLFVATGLLKKEKQCLIYATRTVEGYWNTIVYEMPDSLKINNLKEKESDHLQVHIGSQIWVSWDLCQEKKSIHSNIVVVGIENEQIQVCYTLPKMQINEKSTSYNGFISFLVKDTLQVIWNDTQPNLRKTGTSVWTSEFTDTDVWVLTAIEPELKRRRLYSGKEFHLVTSAEFIAQNFCLFFASSRNQHKFFKYAPEPEE